MRLDAQARVDEVLDRLGDLELAALRGRDRPRGGVDLGGEHVHADQRQVGGGRGRLLDQAHDAARRTCGGVGELCDAVVLRIGHRREQDQRVGLVLAEGCDEVGDPPLQQVVAQVHHEGARAEERL